MHTWSQYVAPMIIVQDALRCFLRGVHRADVHQSHSHHVFVLIFTAHAQYDINKMRSNGNSVKRYVHCSTADSSFFMCMQACMHAITEHRAALISALCHTCSLRIFACLCTRSANVSFFAFCKQVGTNMELKRCPEADPMYTSKPLSASFQV